MLKKPIWSATETAVFYYLLQGMSEYNFEIKLIVLQG